MQNTTGKTNTKTRVTIDLNEQDYHLLKYVSEKTGSPGADVMRDALRILARIQHTADTQQAGVPDPPLVSEVTLKFNVLHVHGCKVIP